MRKLISAINNMTFRELKELQKDIENDNEILKKALWNRLQDISNHDKFCTTCFRELENPKYTLIVGDKFKRKLSFCEDDCFHYFISHMKKQKKEERIEQLR